MFNFKKIASSLRIFVRNGAKREIILFSKSNFAFSFKPFLAVQGLVIFLLFVAIASFLIPQSKFNQAAVVRTSITTKNTTIIANGGSVKWTTLVKQSDIKSGQYLLKLPRSATNIKITTINAKQAKAVLQAQPKEQLSLKQRQNLAIASQKKSKAGLFAKLSTFLFADLEQAASDAVQNVVETITQPKDPNVTSASDAMIVDLSQQSTQAPAETPTDESDSTEISVPTPAETAPTTCVSDTDCSSVQTCDNGSCATIVPTIPTETPETPTETLTPTLATINITPLNASLTVGGATQQLTAETLDQDGAHIDAVITWSSDNTAVATVDDAGIVTPISAGVANITASSSSITSAVPAVIMVSSAESTIPSEEPEIQKPAPKPVDTATLSADIVSAQTIYDNAVVGTNTGEYTQSDKDTLQNAINAAIAIKDNPGSTQTNIDEADSALNNAVATFNTSSQYVQVTYETPAPVITEQSTDTGKLITVSADEQPNQPPLVDVLASTKIPPIYKVGQEDKIQIKWKNENNQEVFFHAYDTDNDGKLDYVEWTVPHLSEQVFQIIFISKAFELDENQNILADIYDQVKIKDDIFASIAGGHYIRYTFERPLDNTRDNTIYAKPQNLNSNVQIEVYPVYIDENGNATEGPKVATFETIDKEGTYKVLLTSLQTPTDVFDMKVMNNVDIDFIVDPTPSGDPTSELVEPANSSSVGNLQTIIGTPNSTTQGTDTLFNYLRKLEQDRLNTAAGAATENTTDAGKLQDLLGASAAAQDRVTIFDYIHKLYNNLVNLVAGNIKSGVTIGGLTGTYTSGTGLNLKTGQTSCYNGAGGAISCTGTGQDADYSKGLALAYTDNGDGTITDTNTNLMWVKQPERIIPNSVAVNNRGAWATSTAYALNDIVNAVQFSGVNASRSGYTVTAASGTPFDTSCVGRQVFIGGVSQGIITARTSNTVVTVSETGTTASGALTVNAYYKCITAHTSGTFLTDLASLDWKEKPSQVTVAGGDWANSTAYSLGTVVRDAGGVNATAMNITGVTTANPAVVTVDNLQGVTSGQSVLINNITWSSGSGLNGNIYYALVNATAKTLTLYSNVTLSTGVNNTATYGSGGTATQTKFYVAAVAHTSITSPSTLADDIAAHPTYWAETVWTASAANLTTPSTMAWFPTGGSADSINFCENLSYAGYTDWRLPNIKELFGIVIEEAGAVAGVKASGAPYINQIVFPNTVSGYYWSSTTGPGTTTTALHVAFNNGGATNDNKTNAYYVRCVRGQ